MMSLNWQALGAIGEVIGAGAVLVTLVYLAAQIRQNSQQIATNTRVTRLAAPAETQAAFSRFRHMVAGSTELAELYIKGCADYPALSRTERLRFTSTLQELLLAFDLLHQRFTEGLYEEEMWDNQRTLALATLNQPGVRDWWSRNSLMFRPQFVAELESAIARASSAA